MRNILIFPDGGQQSFMYPENREIIVGEQLQVQLKDENIHILRVERIQKTDNAVYYHLSYE